MASGGFCDLLVAPRPPISPSVTPHGSPRAGTPTPPTPRPPARGGRAPPTPSRRALQRPSAIRDEGSGIAGWAFAGGPRDHAHDAEATGSIKYNSRRGGGQKRSQGGLEARRRGGRPYREFINGGCGEGLLGYFLKGSVEKLINGSDRSPTHRFLRFLILVPNRATKKSLNRPIFF